MKVKYGIEFPDDTTDLVMALVAFANIDADRKLAFIDAQEMLWGDVLGGMEEIPAWNDRPTTLSLRHWGSSRLCRWAIVSYLCDPEEAIVLTVDASQGWLRDQIALTWSQSTALQEMEPLGRYCYSGIIGFEVTDDNAGDLCGRVLGLSPRRFTVLSCDGALAKHDRLRDTILSCCSHSPYFCAVEVIP